MTTHHTERVIDLYERYAARRGWRYSLLKIVVVVGALLLARRQVVATYVVLSLALLDSFVKPIVRDGRDLAAAGLGPPVRPLAIGFGVGALMMTTAVAIFWAAGWYRVVDIVGASRAVPRFAYWVLVYALVAIVEEVIFRGLLWRFVERRGGPLGALFVTALLFGLGHIPNPDSSVRAGLAIALEAGLMLGAIYLATGSLWAAIGAHWAWNLFEGPVWGTEVSGTGSRALIVARLRGPDIWTGGGFGPEAGLVVVLLGVSFAIVLLAIAARRGRLGNGGSPSERDTLLETKGDGT
jgi:membrane protease YdiL (CAAX protease family)